MARITYIGNNLEGAQRLPTGVATLGRALRKEGHEVDTASGKSNKGLRLLEMLGLVFRNRKKSDVVLIDTYSTSNFWYAYLAARLCRWCSLKYIPILHGGDLPARLERSPKASRALFAHSLLNVAPSEFLLQVFENAGYTPVKYIPNSLPLKDYPFRERQVLRPKLLWVRAFAEIYNPFLALQVLEGVLKRYPGAELCMVGPRKDTSWERCRRYALEKELPVRFTGKLEKKKWLDLAADYDLFLNTTDIDNAPLSVIEAMALGLPVVSTNVGGLPFLVRPAQDGLLVPPGDPKKMAEAVLALLEDQGMAAKLSFSARKKVEGFDWEQVKGSWEEVLALGKRGG